LLSGVHFGFRRETDQHTSRDHAGVHGNKVGPAQTLVRK
jgi:hypothetical protein